MTLGLSRRRGLISSPRIREDPEHPRKKAILDRAIVISCVDRKLSLMKPTHVISYVDRKLSISAFYPFNSKRLSLVQGIKDGARKR